MYSFAPRELVNAARAAGVLSLADVERHTTLAFASGTIPNIENWMFVRGVANGRSEPRSTDACNVHECRLWVILVYQVNGCFLDTL